MTRLITILFMVLLVYGVSAQRGIRGLINAEKQFAWFTSAHTIKEGFLAYMDSSGVVFRNGTEMNALEVYRKQNASPGILSWEPAFAVISASGEMGATTGPYEFRAKSRQDTASGRGGFFSIWHINKQGEWKNIADLGSAYKTAAPVVQGVKEIVLTKQKTIEWSQEQLLQLDKKFNQALQEKNIGAWMPYISTDSWLNLDGQLPASGMLQIADAFQKLPGDIQFSTKTGEISAAGDFAYTYGSVIASGKTNNYLRAWIYRNRQWQVIIQTIRF